MFKGKIVRGIVLSSLGQRSVGRTDRIGGLFLSNPLGLIGLDPLSEYPPRLKKRIPGRCTNLRSSVIAF